MPDNLPDTLTRAHLIGIGGAGMSGIARILLARGAQVSGSDAKESRAFLSLRAQGAEIAIGQRAENLDAFADGPSSVVVSTAIKESNPELVAARERGITVLHRAEALAGLMRGHRVACIAGTHGKTSTTSMLTVALQHCRLDPSFAIGGDLNESGANAHHGEGGVFVAEADESDGSFLAYSPTVAVVTNVEPDHLDHHGTAEAYVSVFTDFLGRIEPGGLLIVCGDDAAADRLGAQAEDRGIRVRRYGRSVTGADDAKVLGYTPAPDGGVVRVSLQGNEIDLRVAVPGEHMALNAIAALLAGIELGAPVEGLAEGLAAFGGVRRRFEFKGRSGDVRVYDDYAHHPTEVDAQLRAVRTAAGTGRVVVVFQPHLYSRTKTFSKEFAAALSLADEVVVLDVFGAREEPEPGVSGALIADQISGATVHYQPAFDVAAKLAADLVEPGDLLVTMGAGDVTQIGPEILAELDRRAG
ncbi:UDP-N-acetylmuramate--L-alanine ligase [Amycolatopsis regifaucium]|uniref:UDP-N-acetylmuramate--L-alanine ligase n=1 Tax=Amycolatopsis regifaucium TaxID=546365 RepID=A0A154MJT4_9PSEU|nr:UDP-N-acetylmuramate--L-alanine ligase [Amycolatopsis regifaucium]KZB84611.1 UDP-N-acetylmuramate--alanine ligase [Amycolatopsis regifaucium]OKA11075.1 UDP-N-acetylmuramate--L-alanine ligase [Amycolatopsis regifaucium]SFI27781.1 UDP-N-acetylmuramate--L-alanine ligase [Amycolatopsis regifaucium]